MKKKEISPGMRSVLIMLHLIITFIILSTCLPQRVPSPLHFQFHALDSDTGSVRENKWTHTFFNKFYKCVSQLLLLLLMSCNVAIAHGQIVMVK